MRQAEHHVRTTIIMQMVRHLRKKRIGAPLAEMVPFRRGLLWERDLSALVVDLISN